MDEGREYVEGLRRCREELEDPRVVPRCDHLLLDIVLITLLAVMCGAEDWPDIEQFGTSREDFLKTFLELPAASPRTTRFAGCSASWIAASSRRVCLRGRRLCTKRRAER